MFKVKPLFTKLSDIPEPSVGAPIPVITSGEHDTTLCYYMEASNSEWDGETSRMVGKDSIEDYVAVIKFKGTQESRFGPPDENEVCFHPILEPLMKNDYYWAFEFHDGKGISSYAKHKTSKHYFFAFHDSSFEIIADSYTVKIVEKSSVIDVLRLEI